MMAGAAAQGEHRKHPTPLLAGEGEVFEETVSHHTTRLAPPRPVPGSPDLHYVAITNALIDFDLTPRQFQLVVTLLSYRWYPTSPIIPSVKTLAGRLRCSVRTVQYALRGLERKRLIERQHTFRPDGGQMSNVYLIGPALAPLLAEASTPSSGAVHPPVQRSADKRPERKSPNGKSRSQPGVPTARRTDYTGGPLSSRYVRV